MTELDHPCRDTCSGWKQGYERGAQDLTAAYMSGFEAAKDKYEAREAVLVEVLRGIATHKFYGAANMRNLAKVTLKQLESAEE